MNQTTPEYQKLKQTFFQHLEFIASYPAIKIMPIENFNIEVAFIGRSNSGKSTLLNKLCGQVRLAKSGKTPGLTRAINIFANKKNPENADSYIVDLPGYGYAKMSHTMADEVSVNMRQYLQKRNCLKAIVILIDSRRLFQSIDWQVLKLIPKGVSLAIAMSKVDKLSTNEFNKAKAGLDKQIAELKIKQPNRFIDIKSFTVSSSKSHRQGVQGIADLQDWLIPQLEIKLESPE